MKDARYLEQLLILRSSFVHVSCIMQKQLEDLWNLVKMKESYVKQMEDRIMLVKNHSKASSLMDHLEPTAVEATSKFSQHRLLNLN